MVAFSADWLVVGPRVTLKFVILRPAELRRSPEKMVSLTGPTTWVACFPDLIGLLAVTPFLFVALV